MVKPRILFIANAILGWKTYSSQLEKVLIARQDLDAVIYWRRPSRFSTAVVKRHDTTGMFERSYRRIDPINAYRRRLGHDIRAMVRETAPDLVHFASHWPAGALLGMKDAPPFTAALDATRPNIEAAFKTGVWNRAELRNEAALLSQIARIFPMSGWAAHSLRDDYGLPEQQIVTIPPAQDLSRFQPRQPHDGLPNVIFVGNDFHRKGGARLVDWVNGPLAGNCHLHIASSDARDVRSGSYVTVHGYVPHDRLIAEIFPRMDILCLPTELDMSPHVLVEAAAAGLPAIATRSGGIPDLVRDGKTGLLVAPGRDDDFIAALRGLIASPSQREAMGRAARRHAETHFDAGIVMNRMLDDIADIANRRLAA